MEITNITIASEYWETKDLDEISAIFPQTVERRKIERWALEGHEPALWIAITWVGKEILSGILNSLGHDVWENLKSKISKKVAEKNYPGLTLSFKNGDNKIEFDLRSNDPKIIEKGFESMNQVLKTIDNINGKFYFNFNRNTHEWEKLKEKKFVKTITGVCAGSDVPIVKDGKTFVLKDEDLPTIAKMNEGLPFTLGHDGKIVGRVTKTWIEGKLVKFEAGIYEGLTAEEMEELDKLKGVSMGFSRPED